MLETSEDNQLINKYLKGDEKSLELLINKYLKSIYSFVYKNIGNPAESEDLTQEIFLKIWKNLKKFDQSKNFKPWLYQIARNTAIDYLRKKKSIPFSRFQTESGQNILLDTLTDDSKDLLEDLHKKDIIEKVTFSLDTNERKLIDLRHKQGMSFQEISDIFKESINTIKSRYRRIIKNLEETYKPK